MTTIAAARLIGRAVAGLARLGVLRAAAHLLGVAERFHEEADVVAFRIDMKRSRL